MELKDFDLKLNKTKNNIIYSGIMIIITGIILLCIGLNNWSFIIMLYLIYNMVILISNIVDYNILQMRKKMLEQKEKEKRDSFDRSYKQYKKYDQFFKKTWESFYNMENDNVRERVNRERERFERERFERERERERIERERERIRNERLFNEWFKNRTQNKQQHNNFSNEERSSINTLVNIENAFKLMKLTDKNSIQEIKSRYRELAIKWHPDKWSMDTKQNQDIANRNFQRLSNAYDIIKQFKNIK